MRPIHQRLAAWSWKIGSRGAVPQGQGRFDQVDFRHELEYGVTDKFQASIYLADWFYKSDPEHSGSTYSDTAIELIYNFTNPVVDLVGLSIYGELEWVID
jgi:hypothetical protein